MFLQSAPTSVIPGRAYRTETWVSGIEGGRYSAYFALIIMDRNGKEVLRKIRWLNDFSGKPKEYSIVAKAPSSADHVVVGYRVNVEGALRSDCTFEFLRPDAVQVVEAEDLTPELHDDIYEYLQESNLEVEFPTLTPGQEEALEKRMVWIFGSPRIGSSWLARQLLAHPDHVIWDEPLIGAHLGTLQYQRYPPSPAAMRTVDEQRNVADYFFVEFFQKAWKPFLRRMILNRIYAQFPEALSKTVIVKEPNGSTGIDIILKSLPQSKAMWLVRDGRDVVDSTIDIHQKNSWAGDRHSDFLTQGERFEAVGFYADLWKSRTLISKKAFDGHDQNLRLLVRYEDLRRNTTEELRRIYQFIGTEVSEDYLREAVQRYSFENIPPDQKGSGRFARKASPGAWRKSFTIDEQKLLHSIMGETLRALGYRTDDRLFGSEINEYERKSHSQNGEDGILQYLFSRVGTALHTFVELGIGDGKECNCASLALNHGWSGLLVDSSHKNISIAKEYYQKMLGSGSSAVKLLQCRVTVDNVNKVLRDNGFNREIDLLSIDIDGNDYWMWKAMTAIDPRVVVIEYNSSFGPERSVTVKYDENFDRFNKHPSGFYHGASLAALTKLAHAKGYILVGCESSGANAFFVRKDLASGILPEVPVQQAYFPHLIRLRRLSTPLQFECTKHLSFDYV